MGMGWCAKEEPEGGMSSHCLEKQRKRLWSQPVEINSTVAGRAKGSQTPPEVGRRR